MSLGNKIAELDDYQAVRFFQHIGGQILAGSAVDFGAIRDGLDPGLVRDEHFRGVVSLSAAEARRELHLKEAAPAARAMLALWAADARWAPAVETTLGAWRDDEMVVETILALGFVASLLMCTASVEFEGQIGTFKFRKGKVDATTIKAVGDVMASVWKFAKG